MSATIMERHSTVQVCCIDIPLVPPSSCSRKSLKMTFNWVKASDVDLCSYALHTFQHFKSIPINCAIKCDDVNCSYPEHRQMIDLFYSLICCALEQSSQKTIPSSNLRDGLDYIVVVVVCHDQVRCQIIQSP